MALEERELSLGAPIFIRIFKESRDLEVFVEGPDGFELFRSFRICKVSGGLGPKRWEGDHQAPEGFYRVTADWMHPNSSFHLAFNIGYPNRFDRELERTGSNIMVHGGCASAGCFAMTDHYMEQIYVLAEAALLNGQPGFEVHVFPFRLTEENLRFNRYSRWHDFWLTLKPGYDYFERHGHPPRVAVDAGRYVFEPHFPDSLVRADSSPETHAASAP